MQFEVTYKLAGLVGTLKVTAPTPEAAGEHATFFLRDPYRIALAKQRGTADRPDYNAVSDMELPLVEVKSVERLFKWRRYAEMEEALDAG